MRRVFTCDKCIQSWEIWYESMHDDTRPKNCPNCNSKKIRQEFTTNTVNNFIEAASHMTVEKAAAINAKRIGKELCQIETEKDKIMSARAKQGKNLPFWHDGEDLFKPRKKNR